jgi:hypothetical protein
MPGFPGNDMVGAGGVSAYTETADNFPIFVVQSQSPTENDDTSYGFSDERVIGLTELLWITGKRGMWVRTAYDAVKGVPGLSSGINVAGRESEIVGTERIRSVRFLR